jgi:hypothetical protein
MIEPPPRATSFGHAAAEHLPALRRELERRGPAHAARGPADQCYLAV